MRSLKFSIIVTGMISLLALGACSSGTPTSSSPVQTTATKPTASVSPASNSDPSAMKSSAGKDENHNKPKQGGQVIESGAYHLELVTAKEEGGTHIDFFLQKGDNHESIPDAKVTAQIQLPDGTQKSLDLAYDAPEKHYTVMLDSKAAGEYKVAILTNIKGEKVNGRFSFNR
jgi:uncharacterized cupredoxin-like copper-binding protein